MNAPVAIGDIEISAREAPTLLAQEFDLPFPPSANDMWSRTRTGMRLSDRYKSWLVHAGLIANRQRRGTVAGPYKLSILAVRPDKRRRDLDNILKATSDLLVRAGAVTDDSYCEMVTARWVTQGEGIHVRVEPAGVEDTFTPIGVAAAGVVDRLRQKMKGQS